MSLETQGHVGTIGECTACHASVPLTNANVRTEYNTLNRLDAILQILDRGGEHIAAAYITMARSAFTNSL